MSPPVPAVAYPAHGSPTPMGRGTLGRKLVLRVVGLVAAIAILLSAFTAFAARTLLVGQVDDQLDLAQSRVQRYGRPGTGDRGQPPGGIDLPGQTIGTLLILYTPGEEPRGSVLRERGDKDWVDDAAAAQLADVAPGKRVSLDLDRLGRYRYESYVAVSGATVGVGLPLDRVDATLANLVGLEILLSLLATGAAALVGRTLVERSLRPLNRLAATAQQVSTLQLDRGEVALAVRVPPEDARPDSEVGRVGLALNHMLNNVEDALAARQASEMKVRQFVADASHELRNPLAAIRGYAELTRRGQEPIPTDAAYAMSRVESEAERMSRLVEDLLLLARLDAGPALDIQPCDLAYLMANAVSDARAAGPDHSWSLELPDHEVSALVDAHRLHQVVANLLANARTHTPAGTRVSSALEVVDGRAVISVTDDGPGIPTDIADKIFERFTRADTSRVRAAGAAKGASTGLGLAIVSAVVEAHHGTVRVDSRPGRTRFEVRLPLTASDPATPTPVPASD